MHLEDLLNRLLTRSTDEPVSQRDVRTYAEYELRSVGSLMALPARVIPLVVMRTVLSDESGRFDPEYVPSRPLFVERYADALTAR